MDELFIELKLQTLDDWYGVTSTQLSELKSPARSYPSYLLLIVYVAFGSIPETLAAAYPEHKWEFYKFRQYPSKTQNSL